MKKLDKTLTITDKIESYLIRKYLIKIPIIMSSKDKIFLNKFMIPHKKDNIFVSISI